MLLLLLLPVIHRFTTSPPPPPPPLPSNHRATSEISLTVLAVFASLLNVTIGIETVYVIAIVIISVLGCLLLMLTSPSLLSTSCMYINSIPVICEGSCVLLPLALCQLFHFTRQNFPKLEKITPTKEPERSRYYTRFCKRLTKQYRVGPLFVLVSECSRTLILF